MPSCYLLAVCQGAALDAESNSLSLFNLVEGVRAEVPFALPVETHVAWEFDESERGLPFEMRLCLKSPDGEEPIGSPILLKSEWPRYRLRLTGLPIRRPGKHHLTVQWRQVPDGPWQRCALDWPLDVDLLQQRPSAEEPREEPMAILRTREELQRNYEKVQQTLRPVDPSQPEVVPGLSVALSPAYGVVLLDVQIPAMPNGAKGVAILMTVDDVKRLRKQLDDALTTIGAPAQA